MDEAVRKLAADSGVLRRIAGNRTSAGYASLDLTFDQGTLRLTCDADTDEILVCVSDGRPASDFAEIDDADDLSSLVGGVIDQAWTMSNDRGYVDAFQIRCLDPVSRRESCCQFEVGAAAITVKRVSV
jgi:hypothetical protein